jgi:hypothetical protein
VFLNLSGIIKTTTKTSSSSSSSSSGTTTTQWKLPLAQLVSLDVPHCNFLFIALKQFCWWTKEVNLKSGSVPHSS